MSTQLPAVRRLLDHLAPVMERHGFRPVADRSAWTGKFNIFSWQRGSWKSDVVRFGWRKPPIATCFLDAQWSVPRPNAEHLVASALNASHSRRGLNILSLPKAWPLIGAWIESRWRAGVVADAGHAIAWCDRCQARAGALTELKRLERNGPRAGSEAYLYIEEYINAHAPE